MGKSKGDEVIFIWSDPHAPCIHEDTLDFIKAVKKKYGPFSKVICTGDEIDAHSIAYHDKDPELPSPADEFNQAIVQLQSFYSLFPNLDLLESNHGSLVYRKGFSAGLPRTVFRTYREILQAPRGWRWHQTINLKLRNGQKVYFHHGLKSNGLALAKDMGCCVVQGHFHTVFNIQYTSNPANLNWSMQVGCCFDDNHRAFRYNKLMGQRPILGHGVITNGQPRLLPMILNKNHRWNGDVP